jgi:hypothetical protein
VEELFLSAIECTAGGGIRQTEVQTAQSFVPEPSASDVEVAISKLVKYKSPGPYQIPAGLIQEKGDGKLHSEVHKLIMLIWNKE